MKLKRTLFLVAVIAILITATYNCFAFGGGSTLGFEKETCTIEKNIIYLSMISLQWNICQLLGRETKNQPKHKFW